ncbi:hypothetical protein CXG81DRAFT_28753 [Caulochytrium protostelioides]|uniref:NUP160 middle TPR domain-containing protein n=1 Tax=Caulochytrium protostelioides TaxID=1555241 RepID=A0A4P9WYA3_9FUNG|nr:hypothetical protein CXG81DRAFT_28753 [Caulochytrium protostelioides]|eukprot:RKO98414.1 hypothetical protein CXG81DRAFT_28753 [Caulochytrium protostelioides]
MTYYVQSRTRLGPDSLDAVPTRFVPAVTSHHGGAGHDAAGAGAVASPSPGAKPGGAAPPPRTGRIALTPTHFQGPGSFVLWRLSGDARALELIVYQSPAGAAGAGAAGPAAAGPVLLPPFCHVSAVQLLFPTAILPMPLVAEQLADADGRTRHERAPTTLAVQLLTLGGALYRFHFALADAVFGPLGIAPLRQTPWGTAAVPPYHASADATRLAWPAAVAAPQPVSVDLPGLRMVALPLPAADWHAARFVDSRSVLLIAHAGQIVLAHREGGGLDRPWAAAATADDEADDAPAPRDDRWHEDWVISPLKTATAYATLLDYATRPTQLLAKLTQGSGRPRSALAAGTRASAALLPPRHAVGGTHAHDAIVALDTLRAAVHGDAVPVDIVVALSRTRRLLLWRLDTRKFLGAVDSLQHVSAASSASASPASRLAGAAADVAALSSPSALAPPSLLPPAACRYVKMVPTTAAQRAVAAATGVTPFEFVVYQPFVSLVNDASDDATRPSIADAHFQLWRGAIDAKGGLTGPELVYTLRTADDCEQLEEALVDFGVATAAATRRQCEQACLPPLTLWTLSEHRRQIVQRRVTVPLAHFRTAATLYAQLAAEQARVFADGAASAAADGSDIDDGDAWMANLIAHRPSSPPQWQRIYDIRERHARPTALLFRTEPPIQTYLRFVLAPHRFSLAMVRHAMASLMPQVSPEALARASMSELAALAQRMMGLRSAPDAHPDPASHIEAQCVALITLCLQAQAVSQTAGALAMPPLSSPTSPLSSMPAFPCVLTRSEVWTTRVADPAQVLYLLQTGAIDPASFVETPPPHHYRLRSASVRQRLVQYVHAVGRLSPVLTDERVWCLQRDVRGIDTPPLTPTNAPDHAVQMAADYLGALLDDAGARAHLAQSLRDIDTVTLRHVADLADSPLPDAAHTPDDPIAAAAQSDALHQAIRARACVATALFLVLVAAAASDNDRKLAHLVDWDLYGQAYVLVQRTALLVHLGEMHVACHEGDVPFSAIRPLASPAKPLALQRDHLRLPLPVTPAPTTHMDALAYLLFYHAADRPTRCVLRRLGLSNAEPSRLLPQSPQHPRDFHLVTEQLVRLIFQVLLAQQLDLAYTLLEGLPANNQAVAYLWGWLHVLSGEPEKADVAWRHVRDAIAAANDAPDAAWARPDAASCALAALIPEEHRVHATAFDATLLLPLYEQFGCREQLVAVGDRVLAATAPPPTPAQAEQVTRRLFSTHLSLGNDQSAYDHLMRLAPRPALHRPCLRRFVLALVEAGHGAPLCSSYSFAGHADHVLQILADRARQERRDMRHVVALTYHNTLYSFAVSKGNYRVAAAAMFRLARRLTTASTATTVVAADGAPGTADADGQPLSIPSIQAQSLLACLNALRLVSPETQWFTYESESGHESDEAAARRGDGDGGGQAVSEAVQLCLGRASPGPSRGREQAESTTASGPSGQRTRRWAEATAAATGASPSARTSDATAFRSTDTLPPPLALPSQFGGSARADDAAEGLELIDLARVQQEYQLALARTRLRDAFPDLDASGFLLSPALCFRLYLSTEQYAHALELCSVFQHTAHAAELDVRHVLERQARHAAAAPAAHQLAAWQPVRRALDLLEPVAGPLRCHVVGVLLKSDPDVLLPPWLVAPYEPAAGAPVAIDAYLSLLLQYRRYEAALTLIARHITAQHEASRLADAPGRLGTRLPLPWIEAALQDVHRVVKRHAGPADEAAAAPRAEDHRLVVLADQVRAALDGYLAATCTARGPFRHAIAPPA